MKNTMHIQMTEHVADGAVKPNLLFHRSWNNLHSRCIEYPFAASTLRQGEYILDIGSAHGSELWLRYLSNQDAHICLSDYDPLPFPTNGANFVQGDCRHLPLPDRTFDRIIAVSVLEHIGLLCAQCTATAPSFDPEGDIAALREWHRLLRPGGELVLTFPFGVESGLVPSATARRYVEKDMKTLSALFSPCCLDYYEYQYRQYVAYYDVKAPQLPHDAPECTLYAYMPGKVTWRRIPREKARAHNEGNMDGILCSVWRKEER